MRRYLRAALKIGVVVGAVMAFSFGAPLILAGALGYFGYRFADGIGTSPSSPDSVDKASKANAESAGRDRSVSRGLLSGWRLSGLPIDMLVDSVNGRDASFTAAGIKGLVSAHQKPFYGDVTYSVALQNQGMAEQADKVIKDKGLDAEVVRGRDGKFSVVCSDVNLADELAKALYPMHDVEVERHQSHHRQYVVGGFGSYEEAEAFLKNNPDGGKLVNSFIKVTDIIDGKVAGEHLQNRPLDENYNGGSLPLGSFIVDVVEESVCKGVSSVPSGEVDVADHVFSHFVAAGGNVEKMESFYSNGTPTDMSSSLTVGHSKEKVILRDVKSAFKLNAYVSVDTLSELKDLCHNGIPAGTKVLVAKEQPESLDGKYVIELPLSDSHINTRLATDCALGYHHEEILKANGIDESQFHISKLVQDCRSDKKGAGVEAFLSSPIGAGEMLDDICFVHCNDGPYKSCVERIDNERLPELSPASLRQWVHDFYDIQMVNFDIDPSRQVVHITSVVGDGSMKTEELPLDKDRMDALVSRGEISRIEMADMLMQLHPDYFKTYSAKGGKSVFNDPVGAFVYGKQPERVSKVNNSILRQPVLPKVRKGSQHKL